VIAKKALRGLLLLTALLFGLAGPSRQGWAQIVPQRTSDRGTLFKAGGFLHFYSGHYGGFSAHLELERAFRSKEFLTSGPRLEYTQYESAGRRGDQYLYVGYAFKFYPLYWKFHKPYQGVFIGGEPMLLLKGTNRYARYGPGAGAILGYQHLFHNRISAGIDASMRYLQNLNAKAVKFNQEDHYFSGFVSINIGLKL